MPSALAIARVSRVVSDLDRATRFYRECLGFRATGRGRVDTATLDALGCNDDAEQIVMRLGQQEIALVQFAHGARPYPLDALSNDLWFQHLAIVVSDMDAAYAHLSRRGGWRPISIGGPQLLPRDNGGVRAFKFRDPDGHPLELIWFPPGQGRPVWHEPATGGPFLGIDHSAIAVSSPTQSMAFYRRLGFTVASRSLNLGPAQSGLDGIANARLHIIGLRTASLTGMGLELLAYEPPGRPIGNGASTDIAADWVTLSAGSRPDGAPQAVRDPDGHRLLLVEP